MGKAPVLEGIREHVSKLVYYLKNPPEPWDVVLEKILYGSVYRPKYEKKAVAEYSVETPICHDDGLVKAISDVIGSGAVQIKRHAPLLFAPETVFDNVVGVNAALSCLEHLSYDTGNTINYVKVIRGELEGKKVFDLEAGYNNRHISSLEVIPAQQLSLLIHPYAIAVFSPQSKN